MANVLRHGDIVLRRVDKLPKGDQKKSKGFTQHGETGKLHEAHKVQVIDIDWRKFIEVPPEGDVMTHPEHPTLNLPAGTFEVTRVRSITRYVD